MKRKKFKKNRLREELIPICPKCHGENIARILYGLYERDEKMTNLINEGKVVLGGCELSFENPLYYCNQCKKEF